jgi:hypothetical protein
MTIVRRSPDPSVSVFASALSRRDAFRLAAGVLALGAAEWRFAPGVLAQAGGTPADAASIEGAPGLRATGLRHENGTALYSLFLLGGEAEVADLALEAK